MSANTLKTRYRRGATSQYVDGCASAIQVTAPQGSTPSVHAFSRMEQAEVRRLLQTRKGRRTLRRMLYAYARKYRYVGLSDEKAKVASRAWVRTYMLTAGEAERSRMI